MKYKKLAIMFSILVIILASILICVFITKDNNSFKQEKENLEIGNIDNRIFSQAYAMAEEKLRTLTLEERVGQLFLVRYPEQEQIEELKKYKFGGYLLFEKDFRDKTEDDVKTELANLKEASDIPLFIAVDEEGGKVVRVSSNSKLAPNRYESPSELYAIGGFEKIWEDTVQKSNMLYNLEINLNLAPVVDVTNNEKDYIYQRTLGKDTNLTSTYAKTVITASKEGKVSYTLKHFPGYSNNKDTHNGMSIDGKSYEEILQNDLPPFKAGIDVGAEAVMVSHNIVTSIDNENPASLSKTVHNILKEEMGFTGVIITDDLDMGAIKNIEDAVVKAVIAGNDLIIVTDYKSAIKSVLDAVQNGRISEDEINEHTLQVLAWKYYKFS